MERVPQGTSAAESNTDAWGGEHSRALKQLPLVLMGSVQEKLPEDGC